MKITKLLAALTGAATIVFAQGALAQNFPAKPIRLVMPYSPGGSSDILARPIANEMSKSLGQQVLIEYKPGAGSTIGADYIAKSAPDGYTLVMLLTAHAINATLVPKLPYDTVKDFSSITLAATLPLVVVVNAQSNIHTMQDLIAAAKANPGKLNYGSAGAGNTSHLAVEYFKSVVGIDLTHVPYKGSGPAVAGLLGREVDLMFDSLSSSLAQIQGGKFRAIGVSTAKRSHVLPQVPTFTEAGLPGYNVTSWYGVVVPAGTPKEIIDKLAAETAKMLALPDFKEKLESQGFEAFPSTPDELAALMKADFAKYAKIIKTANIKIED